MSALQGGGLLKTSVAARVQSYRAGSSMRSSSRWGPGWSDPLRGKDGPLVRIWRRVQAYSLRDLQPTGMDAAR